MPCQYCGALHWMEERVKGSSMIAPRFSVCCSKGTVELPPIGKEPECPLLEVMMANGTSKAMHIIPDSYIVDDADQSW